MRLSPFRLWVYRLLVHNLPETRFFKVKVALLRWAGAQIGENVRINSSAVFLGNGGLVIGNDVWIGAQNFISPIAPVAIVIGSYVDFGPQVTVITGSHEIDPEGEHIGGKGFASGISIADGCWIGARSLLLPGVSLPRKTLVAAGAVVTRSVASEQCLVGGVPAVVKKVL